MPERTLKKLTSWYQILGVVEISRKNKRCQKNNIHKQFIPSKAQAIHTLKKRQPHTAVFRGG